MSAKPPGRISVPLQNKMSIVQSLIVIVPLASLEGKYEVSVAWSLGKQGAALSW